MQCSQPFLQFFKSRKSFMGVKTKWNLFEINWIQFESLRFYWFIAKNTWKIRWKWIWICLCPTLLQKHDKSSKFHKFCTKSRTRIWQKRLKKYRTNFHIPNKTVYFSVWYNTNINHATLEQNDISGQQMSNSYVLFLTKLFTLKI